MAIQYISILLGIHYICILLSIHVPLVYRFPTTVTSEEIKIHFSVFLERDLRSRRCKIIHRHSTLFNEH